MYYLSDDTNLKSHDATVSIKDKPFALFDRQIVTSEKDKIQRSTLPLATLWGVQLNGNQLNYAALEQLIKVSALNSQTDNLGKEKAEEFFDPSKVSLD